MLSNTKGYQKHRRVLGYHRDTVSALAKPCRHQKETGKCKAFNKENHVRREIIREKEAELQRRATAMYELQLDLLADAEHNGDTEAITSTASYFSSDPRQRRDMIHKFVEELKAEPDYLNWNLEGAVAERMVQLHIRPCAYSHRVENTQELKRVRAAQSARNTMLTQKQRLEEDREAASGTRAEVNAAVGSTTPSSSPVGGAAFAAWRAQRTRVFRGFTAFQRSVACLLWQRHCRVPQAVVVDVRRKLEREAEDAFDHRKQADAEAVDNEELDAYLTSAEFNATCEAEEQKLVTCVTCQPSLGVFDLSSLPQLLVYISCHPQARVITSETRAYFEDGDTHGVILPGKVNEKEVDISVPARAEELVEVLEWMCFVFEKEHYLNGASSLDPDANQASPNVSHDTKLKHTNLLFRSGCVSLRALTLRHCQLTSAEALVASLHKHRLSSSLLALDLSDNRLHSLRFLFYLRAHFSQHLLRLSLKNNAITRKPDYQEQVRLSLPRLTALDGESIRRPLPRLPKPWALSYTLLHAAHEERLPAKASRSPVDTSLTSSELALVLDCVSRFMYIWETRRIPLTERELQSFLKTRVASSDEDSEEMPEDFPPEQELDEDNFPHRYLHPSATFSFCMVPGLSFFDAATMRLQRQVELLTSYTGMRLNALDHRDLRVFDVAMKNSSRNLLAGRPAVQRFGRGATNCFLAYQLSLYPERMEVAHHLSGAVVSVVKVADPRSSRHAPAAKQRQPKAFSSADSGRKPSFYVVTLHGVMTWRLPSMRRQECLMAAYDRVLTFVEKVLPAQNRAWERLRSPKLVLYNDQVHLRPAAEGDLAYFTSQTETRVVRLVVEFGLEACKDARALVTAVMERATSEVVEGAALDVLVFGPPSEAAVTEGAAHEQAAAKVARALWESYLAEGRATPAAHEGPALAGKYAFYIFSLLTRPVQASSQSTEAEPAREAVASSSWGAELHVIQLDFLTAMVEQLNQCYSTEAFKPAAPQACD